MELKKIQEFLNRINNTKIKDIDIEKDAGIIKEIIEDWDNYASTSSNDTRVSEFYALRVFFHKYACQIYGNNVGAEFMRQNDTRSNHYNSEDNKIYYQTNAWSTKANAMTLIFQVLHENRHAVQFAQFKNSPDEILKIDPLSIVMLKEIYLHTYHNDLYNKNHNDFVLENDASLCADTQLIQFIRSYLDSNPKYIRDLNMNASQEKENYNTIMQISETIGNLKFKTAEFGTLPVLYQSDRDLKDHITMEDIKQYPLLKLICNEDGTLKKYEELMQDREKYKTEHRLDDDIRIISSNAGYTKKGIAINSQIDRVYQFVINSDPMLYLEDCLNNNRKNKVEELFVDVPELLYSYNSDIIQIVSKYGTLENYKQFFAIYKDEYTNLRRQYGTTINQIESLMLQNQQKPILNYQEKLNELIEKRDSITSAMEQVHAGTQFFQIDLQNEEQRNGTSSKSIISSAVEATEKSTRTGKINEQTQQIKEQEEQNRELSDLEEFIDFIDPQRINDSRFLALLRKYRTEDMSPEEYVEWIEENHQEQIEQTNIEPIDETEEVIR